ncbi:MAG: sulfotransferase family 2 domain-containing protein [Anaerolineae bacterium]
MTGFELQWDACPLYFMHMPKTGGTGLGRWLRDVYGKGYFHLDLPTIATWQGRDVRTFRCYHAWHHGLSLYNWLERPDLAVITMLRDPVERVVSGFYQWQRMLLRQPPQVKRRYRVSMQGLLGKNIEECLQEELLVNIMSNEQVRILGIRKDYRTFFSTVKAARPAEAFLLPYDVPVTVDNDDLPQLFDNACAWLGAMNAVGLTERYAESMAMFGKLLGVPAPARPPRANPNPRRNEPVLPYRATLPPGAVARLEELNRWDIQLYDYARELFGQHLACFQRRAVRTYSVAPRLRVPVRKARLKVGGWVRPYLPGRKP